MSFHFCLRTIKSRLRWRCQPSCFGERGVGLRAVFKQVVGGCTLSTSQQLALLHSNKAFEHVHTVAERAYKLHVRHEHNTNTKSVLRLSMRTMPDKIYARRSTYYHSGYKFRHGNRLYQTGHKYHSREQLHHAGGKYCPGYQLHQQVSPVLVCRQDNS